METKIDSFRGQYRWLSNFYPYPVRYEGTLFPSVEHAYQAAKCLNKQDRSKFLEIDAKAAKALGRKVECREDWDQVKIGVMRELLRKKFPLESDLAEKLINTGAAELIEGNWWGDSFWGVFQGNGENWLGKLLMERRGVLQMSK